MDALDLLIGSKVTWTADRIKTLAEVQPRHIGRVATCELFGSDDVTDYASSQVIGIFHGFTGSEVAIGSDILDWDRMSDLKIWRSGLA